MAKYSKADILDQFSGVIEYSLGTMFGPLNDDDKIVTVPRFETLSRESNVLMFKESMV